MNIKSKIEMIYVISKKKVYTTKNGHSIGYRLSFITLTLSKDQIHNDAYITKNLLDRFLTNMRNVYNWRNYLWVAERQKNGNIHYHIITDANTNYWSVLLNWNRIQEVNGYHKTIIKSNDGNVFKSMENSVDVRRLNNPKKISNYITKYLSKGNHLTGLYKESGSHSQPCNHCKPEDSKMGRWVISGMKNENKNENEYENESNNEYKMNDDSKMGRSINRGMNNESKNESENITKVNNVKRIMIMRFSITSRRSGNSRNLRNENINEAKNIDGEIAPEFYRVAREHNKIDVDWGKLYKETIFYFTAKSRGIANWLRAKLQQTNLRASVPKDRQWEEDQLILLFG